MRSEYRGRVNTWGAGSSPTNYHFYSQIYFELLIGTTGSFVCFVFLKKASPTIFHFSCSTHDLPFMMLVWVCFSEAKFFFSELHKIIKILVVFKAHEETKIWCYGKHLHQWVRVSLVPMQIKMPHTEESRSS